MTLNNCKCGKQKNTRPWCFLFLSHLPDSNWGPSAYKAGALPTELRWLFDFLFITFNSIHKIINFTSYFIFIPPSIFFGLIIVSKYDFLATFSSVRLSKR